MIFSLSALIICLNTNVHNEKQYSVPYKLTDTQHILVRAMVNKHGPYNFIIDSGAPDFFLSTAAAKACGVVPGKFGFGRVNDLEIEGGIKLTQVGCEVDSPFQLTTMNKIGVAGTRLDGVLGYRLLARFKIQIDLSKRKLIFTSSNKGPIPLYTREQLLEGRAAPSEKQIDEMTELAKFASNLIGSKPLAPKIHRGYIGIDIEDSANASKVSAVRPGSPAAKAGLMAGDVVSGVRTENGERVDIQNYESLLSALMELREGDNILFYVARRSQELKLWVTAGRGSF